MSIKTIDGKMLLAMISLGAKNLTNNVEKINALNVFPVPDGDTGTNMNLSFSSGLREASKTNSDNIKDVTKNFSYGLLMGARGNSGVILSQLFRGFSKAVENKDSLSVKEFAEAMNIGTQTAYKAVIKPVEGTILTVAKDSSNKAMELSETEEDFLSFLKEIVKEAKKSLNNTPNLLPVLKQAGVVDSGGYGLVCVYEGFLSFLTGEDISQDDFSYSFSDNKDNHLLDEVFQMRHEGVLSVEDITFGYCTEFMVLLKDTSFDEALFRKKLNRLGDSALVISDDSLVKVHIHAEDLNKVFSLAQSYGELTNIKIENMREQFRALEKKETKEKIPFGIISVAMGSGVVKSFKDMGAHVVIEGGQTMNPSTQDFIDAINSLHAENIIIFPNNSNIILTAEQAKSLSEASVEVIPTKNFSEGIRALLSFDETKTLLENKKNLIEAKNSITTAQITYAVRDTEIDGITIKKNQFMGITKGKIISADDSLIDVLASTLKNVLSEDSDILTIFYGESVTQKDLENLKEFVSNFYEEIELELIYGGQPLYSYLISAE